MAGKKGATRGLTAAALKYFLDHPGAYVRVEDLAFELGEGVTQAQAANAVAYILREGKLAGLSAIQNGNVWLYEPEGDPSEERWLVVRHLANGKVLLEDGNGEAWIAKAVDA